MNDRARLADLANAALSGDEQAYDPLVSALWPNAYRIAWSILGEPSAAEDAAQSACIAICAKLHDLSDVRAFAGWSHRIIVSHARDHARARQRRQRRETIGYETAAAIATREDVSARLDFEAAIGTLPEQLRLALELYYFVGLTASEVGVALGVPLASVALYYQAQIGGRYYRILIDETTAVNGPAAAHFEVEGKGKNGRMRRETWTVPLRVWKHGPIYMEMLPQGLPPAVVERIVRENTL